MNDTDRLIDRLRDLPPDLPDPLDRFELVGERVRRRRRRHTAVAMGGTLAVAALAVPLGAQLLPQSAEVGPGGGVDQVTTGPVTNDADLLPGGTRVAHLSEPVTLTETGTATVELGSRPQGATGVGLVLDCLSAGEFTYPDGAGMICDTGAEPSDLEDFPSMAYVVDLDAGSDEVEIRATEGATWRLTAAYVSTRFREPGPNAAGAMCSAVGEPPEPVEGFWPVRRPRAVGAFQVTACCTLVARRRATNLSLQVSGPFEAEADRNRTCQRRGTPLLGVEARGAHQEP